MNLVSSHLAGICAAAAALWILGGPTGTTAAARGPIGAETLATSAAQTRLTITAEMTDPLGRHVFKLRGTTPHDSPLGVYQVAARVKRVPCPGAGFSFLAAGEDLATGNTSRYEATFSLTSFAARPRAKTCGGKLPFEAGRREASVSFGTGGGGTLFNLMGTRKKDGSFVGSLGLLGLPGCGFPYQFAARFSREARSKLRFFWGMTVTDAEATHQGQPVFLEGCG